MPYKHLRLWHTNFSFSSPSMLYFNLHELFLKLLPFFFWHDRQVDVSAYKSLLWAVVRRSSQWNHGWKERVRVQLKCDGTRWHTGGEVKGKLANGVGSQYSSHYLGTCVSSITTAHAHTSAASSRLNWRPRRFKWTRSFRWKTKSGFCACAITFQTHSTKCWRRNVSGLMIIKH
jgi:hypothetical protein